MSLWFFFKIINFYFIYILHKVPTCEPHSDCRWAVLPAGGSSAAPTQFDEADWTLSRNQNKNTKPSRLISSEPQTRLTFESNRIFLMFYFLCFILALMFLCRRRWTVSGSLSSELLLKTEAAAHPGQLLVPSEHVHSDQLEHASQRRQDLLGDVVCGVEAQAGVLQYLHRPADQLDKGHAGHPIHNDIRYSLADPRLQAPVVRRHAPENRRNTDGVTNRNSSGPMTAHCFP